MSIGKGARRADGNSLHESMEKQRVRAEPSGKKAGLVATVAMHGVAAYALLAHQPVSPAIVPPVPVMVRFMSPPESAKPEPVVQPKPQPVLRQAKSRPAPRRIAERQPVVQPAPKVTPLVAAASEAPAAESAVPAEPHGQEVTPAPAAHAVTQAAAPPAATPPAAAPATTQPNFNADYLQNPAPRYPPLARRMGQQGKVVLRVLVNAGGAPAKIEVRTSSGSETLDDAALDAVKRWRFVPARQGEQPIAAWVLVPITFTLQG